MRFLGKLNRFLQVNGNCSTKNSLEIIDEVGRKRQPKTHWEYAIAQYECQLATYNIRNRLLVIFPFLLLLVILFNFLLLFVALANSIKKRPLQLEGVAALLPDQKLVPDSISGDIIFLGKSGHDAFFTLEDWRYSLLLTSRFLLHPYFVSKSLYAIYQHSGLSKKYSRILVSNEYSFCSSVITHYINRAGGISMNCMHGEKLLNARDAFCRYDIFFVWDEHYLDIFERMNAEAFFVVSHCPALRIERVTQEYEAISYFLQGGESINQISYILEKLEALSARYGCEKIWFKHHPRYRTKNFEAVVGEDKIYRGDNSWLISNSRIVCGRYSTILFQVFVSRGTMKTPLIYLDDKFWTVPKEFIMLSRSDGRFSEIEITGH